MRRSSVALLVCVMAAAGAARAQTVAPTGWPDDRYRPTRGLLLPDTGISGDADATAIEVNPGQLGFARAAPFALAGNAWGPRAGLPGRGWGAFFAIPFVGASAFGLGLQQLLTVDGRTLPWMGGQVTYPEHWKLSLGWGARLGRRLGVGVSWAHLYGGPYAGTDTWDAGATLRLANFLALGVTVQDFSRPRLVAGDPRLPVRWTGELTLRPLGTNAFEVAAGVYRVRPDEPVTLYSPQARARVRLASGLWAFGAFSADRQTLPALEDPSYDLRFTLGLAVDASHASLAAAWQHANLADDVGGGGDGASFLLRAYADRNYAPLFVGKYVARVELEGVSDERGFLRVVTELTALAEDRGAVGVLLEIPDMPAGLARAEELRALIAALRARGKRVLVHLRDANVGAIYVGSAADRIVVHPAASVRWNGVGSTLLFFEGALDKIGVEAQVVRFGAYKGAFEPYTRRSSSEPVRENLDSIIDDRFRRIVDAVAAERPRTGGAAQVRALVDRGLFTPREAVEAGLVDGVATEHEAERLAAALAGDDKLAVREPDRSDARSTRWLRRKVVVVVIDGPIVDGPSRRVPLADEGSVGGDTLVDELEGLAKRRDVGAVVLRVRSPGGSALASDRIGLAVKQLRAAGKPVVVSFGDVAASGGYYVAAYGDEIFAEPSTLTGSIGVIGLKVSVARLFDRIGITTETFKRGAKADVSAPYRPWTPEERDAIERTMRYTYERFLDTVADGRASRGLTREKVDAIGEGHVWSGAQARRLGLVDQLGGVADAIRRAATLGRVPVEANGTPDLEIVPNPTLAELLRGLSGAAAEALDVRELAPPAPRLPHELTHTAASVLPWADEAGGVVLTTLPYVLVDW